MNISRISGKTTRGWDSPGKCSVWQQWNGNMQRHEGNNETFDKWNISRIYDWGMDQVVYLHALYVCILIFNFFTKHKIVTENKKVVVENNNRNATYIWLATFKIQSSCSWTLVLVLRHIWILLISKVSSYTTVSGKPFDIIKSYRHNNHWTPATDHLSVAFWFWKCLIRNRNATQFRTVIKLSITKAENTFLGRPFFKW